MKMHRDVTLAAVSEALMRAEETLDNPGFCIICGAEHEGVDPDAHGDECEHCGKNGVYGAEELMLTIAA